MQRTTFFRYEIEFAPNELAFFVHRGLIQAGKSLSARNRARFLAKNAVTPPSFISITKAVDRILVAFEPTALMWMKKQGVIMVTGPYCIWTVVRILQQSQKNSLLAHEASNNTIKTAKRAGNFSCYQIAATEDEQYLVHRAVVEKAKSFSAEDRKCFWRKNARAIYSGSALLNVSHQLLQEMTEKQLVLVWCPQFPVVWTPKRIKKFGAVICGTSFAVTQEVTVETYKRSLQSNDFNSGQETEVVHRSGGLKL